MSSNSTSVYSYDSPIGILELEASAKALVAIRFSKRKKSSDDSHPIIKKTVKQLDEYFAGNRRTFDLPLSLDTTPFTTETLHHMARIPYGQTLVYSELAEKAGSPKASRAVGNICKTNPFPVIIPCHRVLSKSGSWSYLGGVPAKKWLLKHEGAEV